VTEKLTKDELQNVISVMTARVVKVAELVDQVFPDQEVGAGIKDCAAKLRGHVQCLTDMHEHEPDTDLDFTVNNLPINVNNITRKELTTLAAQDCMATFKILESFRSKLEAASPAETFELQLRVLDVLGTHAREEMRTLTSYDW
jgi:hypothetical protein